MPGYLERGAMARIKSHKSATDAVVPEKLTNPMGSSWPGPTVNVYRQGDEYFTDFSLSKYIPDTAQTFYLDYVNGNDSNAGTTKAAPLKTLDAALNKVGTTPTKLVLAAGVHVGGGTDKQINGQLYMVCEDGIATITTGYGGADFTLDTGTTYVKATHDPLTSGNGAVDFKIRQTDGAPTILTTAADLTTCRSTPGTCVLDTGDFYVNLADGRQPDGDLVTAPTDGNYHLEPQEPAYFKNIRFVGNQMPVKCVMANSADTVVFENCEMAVSDTSNALTITQDKGGIILKNCTLAHGYLDGVNYHKLSAYVDSWLLEINCKSVSCGKSSSDANNASSVHDGVKAIRIGGTGSLYGASEGRVIHDIGSGMSWNCGLRLVKPSRAGADVNVGFASGTVSGSDTTKMWIDGCKFGNPTTDVGAYGSAQAWVRNIEVDGLTTSTTGTPVIAGY